MQYRTLSNGVKLPMIGYGTFQIKDAMQCEQCVLEALEAGYRLFDTAASYENEAAIGAALRSSGLSREAWFITTKLWVQDAGYDGTLRAFDCSLKELGLDQVDLYLIHQPFGDYYGAWRAMERLYQEGAARAIGVSNFTPERLVDLCMNHGGLRGRSPGLGPVFRGTEGHLPPQNPDPNCGEAWQDHGPDHASLAPPAEYPRHPKDGPQGTDGRKSGRL